ncbi:MAG: efflux RND transporter periplasmic adaptor subunit [Lentisphaerae bacterium]|nr:efflux RND transporter periplasmic adaptor subunit [Lentisphaerota bacterium]MCP4101941.1 efflux RND transporter periplasmic adaptor subunit [Lentisphaerota bacterium]
MTHYPYKDIDAPADRTASEQHGAEGNRFQEHTVKMRLIVCSAIIVFAALITATLFIIKPRPKKRSSEELIKSLMAISVTTSDVKLKLSGYGTAEPIRDVKLSSELKGRIVMKSTDLKVGQLVKKGQILAKIDVSDYEIALQEAKAEMSRLKSERIQLVQLIKDTYEQLQKEQSILKLCISDYIRQRDLQRKGISAKKALEESTRQVVNQRKTIINTKSQLNQRKIQLSTTDAQIKRAAAVKKMAEINIERSTIASPFKGRVNKMYIENGEYVQPGTQLFDIADDTQMEIPVALDAYDVAKMLGLTSRDPKQYLNWFKKPENTEVKIIWAEDPELCVWKGKISRIKEFCPETRTVKIIVRPTQFESGSKGFFPLVSGMFCKIFFEGMTLKNAVKIPWVAVQLDGDVYVVNSKGRLEQRAIKIFGTEGDYAIISSGLKSGDLLIVQRLPRGLVNGMKVKPINPSDGLPYIMGKNGLPEKIAPRKIDKKEKKKGAKTNKKTAINIV